MLRKLSISALIIVILVFSLFISGCITQQTTKNLGQETKEKTIVTKIVDGDTIIIQGGESVRLLGIDTPEKSEKYYSEAKNYLEQRILFKEVYLESDVEDKDQYDRLLRYIWLDNSLINLELVQNGLAISRFYDNMRYKEQIQEAETKAIEQRLGLWSQLNPVSAPLPENMNSTVNNAQATTLTDVSPTSSDCISLGCPQGTQYVASKNSDKYHKCSCSFAKKIKQENLLCFPSKEEAEKSRQACSSCKP